MEDLSNSLRFGDLILVCYHNYAAPAILVGWGRKRKNPHFIFFNRHSDSRLNSYKSWLTGDATDRIWKITPDQLTHAQQETYASFRKKYGLDAEANGEGVLRLAEGFE